MPVKIFRFVKFCIGLAAISIPLLFIGIVPVFLYEVVGWKWLTIPWLPIALLGTAVAFVVGFVAIFLLGHRYRL